MTGPKATDPTRRVLLRRLGLAGVLGYVAPALSSVGMARASSSGGSGPSSSGSSSSDSGGPSRPAVRRKRAPSPARAAPTPPPPPPPELVALIPPGAPRDPLLAAGFGILAQRGGVAGADLVRLSLPPGRTPDQALADLALLFPDAPADLNHLYTPDEFLCRDGLCDAHEMVGWSGWPSAHTPRLGMIDTGINLDHAALTGQKLTVLQADLAERNAAGRQHGTAIAALLLGRMYSPVPGLLPHASLIAVEAFHTRTTGEAADAFALADALQTLTDAGVQVVNMSFSGPQNAVFGATVTQALARGIGLVAAAGNGGPGAPPAYPAAWPGVLAVTAVDAASQPYRQAARGPHIAFAAPGVNLWTAASISGGRLRSGTSYAAPFVTAALAVERMRAPAAPLADVVARLADCATDLGETGMDDTFGNGMISSPDQCLAEDATSFPADFRLSGE